MNSVSFTPTVEDVYSDDDVDDDDSGSSSIDDSETAQHELLLNKLNAPTNVRLFYYFLINTQTEPLVAHYFQPLLVQPQTLIMFLSSVECSDKIMANFIKAVAARLEINFEQLHAIYRAYIQRINDVATEVLLAKTNVKSQYLERFSPMDNEEAILLAEKFAPYSDVARDYHTIRTMDED